MFRREASFINNNFTAKTKNTPSVPNVQRPHESSSAYLLATEEVIILGMIDNYISNKTKYENCCLESYFKAKKQKDKAHRERHD